MSNVKVSITLPDRSITLEGEQEFVEKHLAAAEPAGPMLSALLTSHLVADPNKSRAKESLDHAWNWFSLHAGQRMQGINFFLVAVAFLCNAYVVALNANQHFVAASVGLVGAALAYAFYQLEQRIRELVKASEAAIMPEQKLLADAAGNSALEIVRAVEYPKRFVWTYATTLRFIFGITGLSFGVGAVREIYLINSTGVIFHFIGRLFSDRYLAIMLVIGIIFIFSGQSILRSRRTFMESARSRARFAFGLAGLVISLGIVILLICIYICISHI